MNRTSRVIAWTAASALVATMIVPIAAASGATAAGNTARTTATLTDNSPGQQRWLSVAESRTVINPYYFSEAGDGTSEVSYTGSNALPLATAFYAHDKAVHAKETLTTFAAGEAPPQNLIDEDFSGVSRPSGWIVGNASDTYADGKVTVSNSGAQWGYLATPELALNPGVHSKLTVKIDATSPTSVGKWGIKINPIGSADDLSPALQADTTSTGTFVYDLGKYFAEQGKTGVQNVRIRVWATTYETGQSTVSYTMDSFRISQGATPEDGQLVAWSHDFDATTGWTNGSKSNPATLSTSGGLGTVSLASGGDYDYVMSDARSVNLDRTPIVTLKADTRSGGKWALKVSDQADGGSDKSLQGDTEATGTFSFDIAAATGWSGTKNLRFKIFQIGGGTSTTYDRISVHSGGAASAAVSSSNTSYEWSPAAAMTTGTYPSGSIKVSDYFSAAHLDGTVRKIESTIDGAVVVAGTVEAGTPTYSSATKTIVIPGTWATRAIALPLDAEVSFFTSRAAFLSGSSPATEPSSSTKFWSATLPAGTTTAYVGVGWSVNTGKSNDGELAHLPIWTNPYPGGAAAEAAKFATDSRDEGDAGITHWAEHWDDYMARVPVVEDYSIQRVASGGVTADQMEAFYYRAWLNLEMNVLPATPETGNLYLQVGTGKPSLWMSGTPGTRNVASWDSLLGMQQLAYTNPRASWDSFIGMMEAVQMNGVTPTDENGVAAHGALKGESLPSRKAQTAWILYTVTGDEEKLRSIWEQLDANLIWGSHNMRWIYGSNNYTDERDSEFVASLIYDLKFGVRIAELLGYPEQADTYRELITDLTRDYEEWFFPTVGGSAPEFQTVQKVFLDTNRASSPWSDPTEGSDYRDHKGRWVKNGWSFYTTTALVARELSPEFKAKVLNRFLKDYRADNQLAGLGRFAVKAPDIQLITYGLFDEAGWDGGSNAGYSWPAETREALIDKGTVLVNAYNRDMVKSGFFAEVYYQSGDGTNVSAGIGSRGVRPSLFGVSHYIDNIWIANGYRVDEGDPTFIRLTGATGGLKGLTYMGKTFDLDIDAANQRAVLTGDAVGGSVGLPSVVPLPQAGVPSQPGTNPVPASTNADLSALTYGGVAVPGFAANKTAYAVELPAGTTTVPIVAATKADAGATVQVHQANDLPGTATVTVTAEDGTTVKTYTVAFTVKLPTTAPQASITSAPATVKATFGKAARIGVTVTAGNPTTAGQVVARRGTSILARAAVIGGKATLVLPKNLKAGRHSVQVTFTPANAATVAGSSTTVSVQVAKARTKVVSAKVTRGKAGKSGAAARSVKRAKAARIQVRLAAVAGANPTGRVTLKAGKRTIGKATVKRTKAGRYVATISIKAKSTRAIKKTTKIKAVYSGNANLAKRTYTTKLRVIR